MSKINVVLLGDGAVGKSAITLRFLRNQFHTDWDPTIEDVYNIQIELDGQKHLLEITDTAGQEEYRGNWNDKFMRIGDGFICVYSIVSMDSFLELASFRDQIWRAKETDQVPMVIAGNKSDLVHEELERGQRLVDPQIAAEFAHLSNASFFETSAKTGFQIQEAILDVVRQVVQSRERERQEKDHHHHHHHHHQHNAQQSRKEGFGSRRDLERLEGLDGHGEEHQQGAAVTMQGEGKGKGSATGSSSSGQRQRVVARSYDGQVDKGGCKCSMM